MSKPMLIEALKPGMRAKVQLIGYGEIIVETSDDNAIIFDTASKAAIPNLDVLRSTDYEIIPDEPKPWVPTEGHGGFAVMPYMGEIELLPGDSDHWKFAVKTRQAAEHKAKLDRIFTAILNMPGYGGDGWFVYWYYDHSVFVAAQGKSRFFSFDSEENAQAAAKYANKLMEAGNV